MSLKSSSGSFTSLLTSLIGNGGRDRRWQYVNLNQTPHHSSVREKKNISCEVQQRLDVRRVAFQNNCIPAAILEDALVEQIDCVWKKNDFLSCLDKYPNLCTIMSKWNQETTKLQGEKVPR